MNNLTTPLDNVADADPRHVVDPTAPPEWLLLAIRSVEDGRYLLVRRPGNRLLTMLSTAPPHRSEGFSNGIASLVRTHLGVTMRGAPRIATAQRPVHTLHPYTGGQRTGYLRALAVEVAGDPKTDALYEGMEALRLTDAINALATDLERLLLQDGARLLGDTVPTGWRPDVGGPVRIGSTASPSDSIDDDDSDDLEDEDDLDNLDEGDSIDAATDDDDDDRDDEDDGGRA